VKPRGCRACGPMIGMAAERHGDARGDHRDRRDGGQQDGPGLEERVRARFGVFALLMC
jgi:hypothetical protein